MTFCLFCSSFTGSYDTGKPRVDLKREDLQRLYAPVVAAHDNRTVVQELAGASSDVQIYDTPSIRGPANSTRITS